MRPAYYQDQWKQLKDSTDAVAIASLAQRIASSFVDRYFYSDEYNAGYIELLCAMATHYRDPDLNQVAARALFGIVIERLCDDFEELQTETYNRLICQVISYLRQLPDGEELDRELNGFQLESEDQLYQRIESIRLSPDEKISAKLRPKKVLILSRVTIGADVAITSVICQRVASLFPDAAITIAGNPKLKQLFSSESGIKFHELNYSRKGGLLERFLVWLDLLKEVRAELNGLSEEEFLVLDPDSRLTQLGVLPLVPSKNYRFFNSRGKQGYPAKASISELTNLWLDNILGHSEFCFPKIWPEDSSLTSAENLKILLDPKNELTLITLNFGVGGNTRKMVPGDFEIELVLTLLKDPDVHIILDLGFGDEERERSEAILNAAQNSAYKTRELPFSKLNELDKSYRLIGVQCSVSEIAALISCSDEFLGYDSACQHIAAAEGIKTYTVFAGTNNVRFIRRWHACGPNVSEIVYVDTISKEHNIDAKEIIARIVDLRRP
ncbi:MAG: glycosyltransferase family 9 protein [Gammaproteobacteria bacterium]|nr:glycosyltransferase family 9 protein [Gammaproteobacteria bacterium]